MTQLNHGAILLAAACWVSWCCATAAGAAAGFPEDCSDPSRHDPIVFNSTLYGHPNMSDAVAHDDTWAHRRFGPISRLTLFKAWYYDGAWHNPGELKGIQAWHGRYYYTEPTRLLFGAKRPHVPLNCTLYRTEVFVRAELQWDHIFRYMNFTTSLGRWCSWGFPDVANVTKAVAVAPGPNTYIAALRGYEGKPLPPSQGGFKKRYIVQLGFAWAQLNCSNSSTGGSDAANYTSAAAGQPLSLSAPGNPVTQQGPPGVHASAASPVILPVVPLEGDTWGPADLVQALNNTQQPPVPADNSTAAITPALQGDVPAAGVNGSSSMLGGTDPAAVAALPAALEPSASPAVLQPPALASAAAAVVDMPSPAAAAVADTPAPAAAAAAAAAAADTPASAAAAAAAATLADTPPPAAVADTHAPAAAATAAAAAAETPALEAVPAAPPADVNVSLAALPPPPAAAAPPPPPPAAAAADGLAAVPPPAAASQNSASATAVQPGLAAVGPSALAGVEGTPWQANPPVSAAASAPAVLAAAAAAAEAMQPSPSALPAAGIAAAQAPTAAPGALVAAGLGAEVDASPSPAPASLAPGAGAPSGGLSAADGQLPVNTTDAPAPAAAATQQAPSPAAPVADTQPAPVLVAAARTADTTAALAASDGNVTGQAAVPVAPLADSPAVLPVAPAAGASPADSSLAAAAVPSPLPAPV